MKFEATLQPVVHGARSYSDTPPTSFLHTLIEIVRELDDSIFASNSNPHDVFTSIFPVVQPWTGVKDSFEWFQHRKAAMCEVLRVLGGFESTWNWKEGKDMSSKHENDADTMSAGLWQISYDSRSHGDDLNALIQRWGIHDGMDFQWIMKNKVSFAIEYAIRLFRHTTHHNGPLLRHEVDEQMSRAAIDEFKHLLNEPL